MPLDTISTPTIVNEIPFSSRVLFAINGIEADASTAIEIKAAPGVGKSIYITSVLMTSDDADANPFLQDEDDNVLFGPPFTTVEGVVYGKDFKNPIKLATNKALELKATAGNVSIWVEGAIADGDEVLWPK